MIKKDNLVFLPNTGDEQYYPVDKQGVDATLLQLSRGDHPNVTSLNYTPVNHESTGMIPIKNKPKR
jgi:hypothetical protein